MSMFGEINLPTSRIDDVSDDSGEEEIIEPGTTSPIRFVYDKSALSKLSSTSIKTILVTCGKKTGGTNSPIGILKFIRDNVLDEVGCLYQLSASTVCFHVFEKNVSSFVMGDIIEEIFIELSPILKGNPEFILISRRESDDGDKVRYLHGESPSSVAKELVEEKMMAPDMVFGKVQASLFEYVSIAGIPCTFISLPKFSTEKLSSSYPSPIWDELFEKNTYLKANDSIFA